MKEPKIHKEYEITILGFITLTFATLSALTNIFVGCRIYKLRLENYKLEKKIEMQKSAIADLEENLRINYEKTQMEGEE